LESLEQIIKEVFKQCFAWFYPSTYKG
jgi:hypothetical protein